MNLNEIVSLFAAVLILLGSIVALISAIGIVKFKDVFLRALALIKATIEPNNIRTAANKLTISFRFKDTSSFYKTRNPDGT